MFTLCHLPYFSDVEFVTSAVNMDGSQISMFATGRVNPVDITRGVEKIAVRVRDPEDVELVTDFVVSRNHSFLDPSKPQLV